MSDYTGHTVERQIRRFKEACFYVALLIMSLVCIAYVGSASQDLSVVSTPMREALLTAMGVASFGAFGACVILLATRD